MSTLCSGTSTSGHILYSFFFFLFPPLLLWGEINSVCLWGTTHEQVWGNVEQRLKQGCSGEEKASPMWDFSDKEPKCKQKLVPLTCFQGHLNTVIWMLIILWFEAKAQEKEWLNTEEVGSDEVVSELKEFLLSCDWKPGQGCYQDISHLYLSFIILLFCFIWS